MQGTDTMRVMLLGKTGAGKSSMANTIFEEDMFKVNNSPNSETKSCQSQTKTVHGRSLCLIDTPGLFDTDPSSSELSPELLKCVTECAPGPHAFLLVLKVEKFTKQEQAVVDIILEYFTEEALKFSTVVFTNGDNLSKGMKIEEWVRENEALNTLVQKCGGRCHVIDNKYWNNSEDQYRNNQHQVEQLLTTIDQTVRENKGGYYTNEMLQGVHRIQQEQDKNVLVIRLAGISTGILLGAFLGGANALIIVMYNLPGLPKVPSAACGAVLGAAVGGYKGYKASEQAETPMEAVQAASKEMIKFISQIKDMLQDKSGEQKISC